MLQFRVVAAFSAPNRQLPPVGDGDMLRRQLL